MDEALKAKAAYEQAHMKEAPVASNGTKFNMPDLTPAQITADVVFIVGLAAAFGLKIDGDTSTTLTAAAIAGFAFINAAHKLADAFIRGKRADNADKL